MTAAWRNPLAFMAPSAPWWPLVDPTGLGREWCDYWRDTAERQWLYLDVMRRRGNQYLEHIAKTRPHVLGFETELIMDGRDLPHPVNYELMRVIPPDGVDAQPGKRPFVVVDPRAGHGPGIGGFKPDSEIGVALKAGHPCYFVGFLPHPVRGQQVEDVVEAEIEFLKAVIERHPDISEKPMVVGNCQAGWQIMMAAALEPDCFGPILIAGAPLSYWAGERGKAPMRYTGGMVGGSWSTAFASDLGDGLFDGAWLVQNFENMNPANTLWSKQYRLFSQIDTEAKRYLDFERWWGGHVVLAADEIQYIVDQLFIGNRLSTAQLITRDGRRIDLRNVRSPIVVFCSKGDDITPPPQALGWVRDLYANEEDLVANDQTIVYCIHDTTGHLGIFVSSSVSRKEHTEFTDNMDYIDVLPPGLYRTDVNDIESLDQAGPSDDNYLLTFTRQDIESLDEVVNPIEADDRRFAAVEHLSRVNLGIYRTWLQPLIRAVVTPETARLSRRFHPLRLRYRLFSDNNPVMSGVAEMAAAVTAERHPVNDHNRWRQLEKMGSDMIENTLDKVRDLRDEWVEQTFMTVYGREGLQLLAGLGAQDRQVRFRPGVEPEHRRFVAQRQKQLRERVDQGGVKAAVMRAIIHILGGGTSTDERNFERLEMVHTELEPGLSLSEYKAHVREQFLILRTDHESGMAALPQLLKGTNTKSRQQWLERIEHVVEASSTLDSAREERLIEVRQAFLPKTQQKPGVEDSEEGDKA